MNTYRFTYQSIGSSEEQMLNDFDHIAQAERLDPEYANRIRLSISEAFTNALIHANRMDADKTIELSITVNYSQVVADIEDQGRGGLGRIARRRKPDPLSEGGRGVDLIQHYADQVDLAELEHGGLRVRLTFDREREEDMKQR